MTTRQYQSTTSQTLSNNSSVYASQSSENSQSKLPALLETLSSESILRLEDQFLGDRGASVLADFLTKHTHFVSIELRGNNLTSSSFVVICKALKTSQNLKNLKAEWNLIGDGGDTSAMEALSELASALPSLQTIDLRNNKIGKGCGPALSSIIRDAWSLQKLDLRWNELTDSEAKYILEALRASRRTVQVSLAGNKSNGQRISETLVNEISKCGGDLDSSFQEQSSFSSSKKLSPPSSTPSRPYIGGQSTQYQSTTTTTAVSRNHSRTNSRGSPTRDTNYFVQRGVGVNLKNQRSESKENRQVTDVQKRLEFSGDQPQAKPLQTRNSSIERRNDQSYVPTNSYKTTAHRRVRLGSKPSLLSSQNFGDILEEKSDLPTRDNYQLATSPNKHSLSPNHRESNYTSVKTSPNRRASPHSRGNRLIFTPETKMTNTSMVDDSSMDIQLSRIEYEKEKNLMQRRYITHVDKVSGEENMIDALEKMLEAERQKNIELARNIRKKLQEEIDEERKAKLAAIQKEEQLKIELKRKMIKEEEARLELGRLSSECERLLQQKQSLSDELAKAKSEQSIQMNELTAKNEAQVKALNEEVTNLKNELKRIIEKHTQELREAGKEWENKCLKLGAEVNELKIQLKSMALDQENEILLMEKRVREEEFQRYQNTIAELNKKREELDKKALVDKRDVGTSPSKEKLNEMNQENEYILAENNILRSQLKEAILLNQELEIEFTTKEQRLRDVEGWLQEALQNSQKIKELHEKEMEKVISGHRIERRSWEEVESVLKSKINELERDIERIKEEGKKIKTEYYGMKQVIQGNVNRVITDTFKDHRTVDKF